MSAKAFIAFLRCEATQAEERARALRCVAANIESHATAEAEPSRKILKRKAVHDPNRPKRQHTAYSMYVTANYESIKQSNPDIPSKDMIATVARQWAQISEDEKEHWKERAIASAAVAEMSDELAGFVEDDDDANGDDDNREQKRGASSTKKPQETAVV